MPVYIGWHVSRLYLILIFINLFRFMNKRVLTFDLNVSPAQSSYSFTTHTTCSNCEFLIGFQSIFYNIRVTHYIISSWFFIWVDVSQPGDRSAQSALFTEVTGDILVFGGYADDTKSYSDLWSFNVLIGKLHSVVYFAFYFSLDFRFFLICNSFAKICNKFT